MKIQSKSRLIKLAYEFLQVHYYWFGIATWSDTIIEFSDYYMSYNNSQANIFEINSLNLLKYL